MIEIANVTVRRGGRALLNHVSLALHPGELVAVLGPNGAGKSTLVRVISRELEPDSGVVRIDGQPADLLSREALARRRAVLPQSSNLAFPLTVAALVRLGRTPHIGHATPVEHEAAVERALRRAGIAEMRQRWVATLSGGEQQRAHLARVFAQLDSREPGARHLLLDEPTSSLDLAHQHQILSSVQSMARDGVAVLAVLHDPNLASRYADRVVLLRAGGVWAIGTPREVLRAELIQEVFGLRARVLSDPDGSPVVVAG